MAELGRYYLFLMLFCLACMLPAISYADEAWVPQKEDATKKEEDRIFEGCSLKAEYVFDIAQERIYNHGDTEKLLAYLKEHMSQAEYRINEKFMRWLGEWVDSHQFKTAHEYSMNLMAECVTESYKSFDKRPTDRAALYWTRFQKILDNTDERLFKGKEISA